MRRVRARCPRRWLRRRPPAKSRAGKNFADMLKRVDGGCGGARGSDGGGARGSDGDRAAGARAHLVRQGRLH